METLDEKRNERERQHHEELEKRRGEGKEESKKRKEMTGKKAMQKGSI